MSNNDLISREALNDIWRLYKQYQPRLATNVYEFGVALKDIIDIIPTVEERPHGEWIVSQTYDCHSDIVNVYTCPFCGEKAYRAYPFCHCGAKMKHDTKQ